MPESLLNVIAAIGDVLLGLSVRPDHKAKLRAALEPIGSILQEAVAAVPFSLSDQDLRSLDTHARSLRDLAAVIAVDVPGMEADLKPIFESLAQLSVNPGEATYSSAFAVVRKVRVLQSRIS